jgi:photosystem II biogenesis protein Psp29
MKGYKPEKHLDLLFESLCSSTNFEATEIKEISQKYQKEFKDKSSKDVLKILKEKNNSKLYPSRILNLGIFILISNSQDLKVGNESEQNKIISDAFENLKLSSTKAEKDIGIYKSSITKIKQAKELIEELRIKEKDKAKRKQ